MENFWKSKEAYMAELIVYHRKRMKIISWTMFLNKEGRQLFEMCCGMVYYISG